MSVPVSNSYVIPIIDKKYQNVEELKAFINRVNKAYQSKTDNKYDKHNETDSHLGKNLDIYA